MPFNRATKQAVQPTIYERVMHKDSALKIVQRVPGQKPWYETLTGFHESYLITIVFTDSSLSFTGDMVKGLQTNFVSIIFGEASFSSSVMTFLFYFFNFIHWFDIIPKIINQSLPQRDLPGRVQI